MKIGPNCQPKINYTADRWAMENICHFLIFWGTLYILPSPDAQTLLVTCSLYRRAALMPVTPSAVFYKSALNGYLFKNNPSCEFVTI
jgi:hypothetical protein